LNQNQNLTCFNFFLKKKIIINTVTSFITFNPIAKTSASVFLHPISSIYIRVVKNMNFTKEKD